jgi:hypothetical protein
MRSLLVIVSLLFLAACSASPTKYQKLNSDGTYGGYRELAIGDSMYRIAFVGNTNTGMEAVDRYALYRCAELTVQHGGTYFELIGDKGAGTLNSNSSMWQDADGAYGSYSESSTAHTVFKTIRIHSGVLPANARNAYDPSVILKDMDADIKANESNGTNFTSTIVIVFLAALALLLVMQNVK